MSALLFPFLISIHELPRTSPLSPFSLHLSQQLHHLIAAWFESNTAPLYRAGCCLSVAVHETVVGLRAQPPTFQPLMLCGARLFWIRHQPK